MVFTRFSLSRFSTFIILLALPMAAFAANIGTLSSAGSVMEWQLNATGYESVELRISDPDGNVRSFTFKNGTNPSVNLQELGGLDGLYAYELIVKQKVPASVQKQLDSARASNDSAAVQKTMKEAGLLNVQAQAGTITSENGTWLSPDLRESSARDRAPAERQVTPDAVNRPNLTPVTNDQVIPDDLIVQGSTCVGLDCVNNESFGFDTIRMKENNTRIKFEDTSTGAFPTNDWQLTANDSASGASSKFSIEDITGSKVPFTVTAGATTNSIFVSSTGRVGFRTSTPVLDLHVATSDTPAIRLEQNSSGGFTAQTWDIAGNEANFFVRDVTGGSRLPFRIRPGAPTSSVDISASGDVGIGDASPEANLHVSSLGSLNPGSGEVSLWVESADNADAIIGLGEGPNFSDNTDALVLAYNGASGVGRGFIGTRPSTGTGQINFAVKNITEMTLTSTGLEVTDQIRVGGTPLNVPDYVFDPGYELMPIESLASFIATEKHLPNIPAEHEIKANGLDLGGFQMDLLRKVEELTLYTVAQHETIKKLEARLAELEK